MTPVYRSLEADANDVIVDVGCGTGDALRYLPTFKAYHGFDIDPVAIEFARKRAAGRPGVVYVARALTAEDLASLRPSLVADFAALAIFLATAPAAEPEPARPADQMTLFSS
jgi:SAM-dependent methyltransferase